MTEGKAVPAIELIEYDQKYEKVMQMVFGSVYVAENEECAKKVAFNKDVQARTCVTLKGDKYDPRGTLHGGFSGKSNVL